MTGNAKSQECCYSDSKELAERLKKATDHKGVAFLTKIEWPPGNCKAFLIGSS